MHSAAIPTDDGHLKSFLTILVVRWRPTSDVHSFGPYCRQLFLSLLSLLHRNAVHNGRTICLDALPFAAHLQIERSCFQHGAWKSCWHCANWQLS